MLAGGETAVRLAGRVTGPYIWDEHRAVPADAVWPSDGWHARECSCSDDSACACGPVFPDWWLGLVRSGLALHPDADEARRRAVQMVAKFEGRPILLPHVRDFVRAAALDSLCLAPAPITKTWVLLTLSSAAGVARWADLNHVPLTREVVFSEETIRRWLQDNDYSPRGAEVMTKRLGLVRGLFGGSPKLVLPRDPINRRSLEHPLSPQEQAQVWQWTAGLRGRRFGDQTQHRVRMYIVLGLGCGLKVGEMLRLFREDVRIDAEGVHVDVVSPKTGELRVITCLADWEDSLVALVDAVPAARPMLTPWKEKPGALNSTVNVIGTARDHSCPVYFTSHRLRHTWIVSHLAAGTPLDVLKKALNITEVRHIQHLLEFVPPADAETAARALRGVRTH